MFTLLDYVETKDGQLDGILTDYIGDGVWEIQHDSGNGGSRLHIHESEIEKEILVSTQSHKL